MRFPDIQEYPPLKEAGERLENLVYVQARELSEAAEAALEDAGGKAQAVKNLEARAVLGEAGEEEVNAARKAALEAREAADDYANRLVPLNAAIDLLTKRIPELEAEARVWVMRQIHPAYRKAVERMQKAFSDLQAADSEVWDMYQEAAAKFPRQYVPGAFPEAGGLYCFALTLFKDTTGAWAAPSQFKQWQEKAAEYLENKSEVKKND